MLRNAPGCDAASAVAQVRDLAVKKHETKCLAILDKYAPVDDDAGQHTGKKKEAFKMSGWV